LGPGPTATPGSWRPPVRSVRSTSSSTARPGPGVDGIPDFNALHSRKHEDEDEVQLAPSVILVEGDNDLRKLRKANLDRLLVAPLLKLESRTISALACW
jgi:hypothetical protein